MFNIRQFFVLTMLLSIIGFSQSTQADVEISAHGGMGFNDYNLTEIHSDYTDQTSKRPWLFGGDVVYRQPIGGADWGVGLRYQLHTLSADLVRGTRKVDGKKFTASGHRLALLGSFRFLNDPEGLFVGAVGGIDLWKTLEVGNDDPGGSIYDNMKGSSSWLWQKPSGQLGLEAGLNFSDFLVKLEGGYSLYRSAVDQVTHRGREIEKGHTNNPDAPLDASGFYFTLGIGYTFI